MCDKQHDILLLLEYCRKFTTTNQVTSGSFEIGLLAHHTLILTDLYMSHFGFHYNWHCKCPSNAVTRFISCAPRNNGVFSGYIRQWIRIFAVHKLFTDNKSCEIFITRLLYGKHTTCKRCWNAIDLIVCTRNKSCIIITWVCWMCGRTHTLTTGIHC